MSNLFYHKKLYTIEDKIGYHFNNKEILLQALSHPSKKTKFSKNYQRYEFFGDKILSFIIAKELFFYFPHYKEEYLTKHHNFLVSEQALYAIAKEIDLQSILIASIPKKELVNKNSILVDSLETLIGAIYIDSQSFEIVAEVVKKLWKHLIYDETSFTDFDPKSALQELAQKQFKILPIYKVEKQGEIEHEPTFYASVKLNKDTAQGMGKSKKEAEAAAAKNLLKILGK